MAKKKSKESKESKKAGPSLPPLPPELQAKLDAVQKKLVKFKEETVKQFDKYILGIGLLPPPKPRPGEEIKPEDKDKVEILILIDDTEPSKMTKLELRDKLGKIMATKAKELDKNFVTQTILLSEVWQSCYDAKYDLTHLVAICIPVHDSGMMAAIRISEVHKNMVMKKFEKYIVSYCLAGSLVQGKATPESDIDVSIIVDDTDVKKMTRAELKDKLRAIIAGMGMEAGEITGVKNKINIQTWILTDFWEGIKEANPVFFTFLRDGIPFYDRGVFMPWKQLLKMGKIKPSPEAIDIYMSSGEQSLGRVKWKLQDIGTEDFFWSILTPPQAALMLYGVPPPTPKETPATLREIFVKKEKLLEEKDVKVLEKVLEVRKAIEHGTKKGMTGKEIDELLESCQGYLERLKKLFAQIQERKDAESMVGLHESVQTICRDILIAEGKEKVPESDLISEFEDSLISSGKVPAKYLRTLNSVVKAKKDYDTGKLTKTEVDKVRKESSELVRFLVEHLQRKRAQELDKVRFRVKYGEKFGEVTLIGKTAFIIRDLDAKERQLEKADVKKDLSFGTPDKATFEELEQSLAKAAFPTKAALTSGLFKSLQKEFGEDVEVLVR
jgi:predicted nucleotidyltransferase/uncharacterized protein (UPF0332 family)